MRLERLDQRWQQEAATILGGFKEWRLQHPRATLSEIEAVLDARWAVARARLLADAALLSAAADLAALPALRGGDGAAGAGGAPPDDHLRTTADAASPLRRLRRLRRGAFPPG